MAFVGFCGFHGAEPSRGRADSGAESFEARAKHTGAEPFRVRAPSHTFHSSNDKTKVFWGFLAFLDAVQNFNTMAFGSVVFSFSFQSI